MAWNQWANDSVEDDLDEWLGEPVPMAPDPNGDESNYSLVVAAAPDEDYADALLRRADRLKGEQARIERAAQRRIDKVTTWKADRVAGVTSDALRVYQSLQLFMGRWHRENPKRKTLPLTNGKLTLRGPGAGRIEVTDERAFVTWAEANGRKDLLRYSPHPNIEAIKAIEFRHVRPQDVMEDKPGRPELYDTWSILADVEVPTDNEGFAIEQVSIPGVRFVRRVEDRFDYKLPSDPEESPASALVDESRVLG